MPRHVARSGRPYLVAFASGALGLCESSAGAQDAPDADYPSRGSRVGGRPRSTTRARARGHRGRVRATAHRARASESHAFRHVQRRDAGEASTLDVELAAVTAGQAANVAAADSLTFLSTVLDLQTVVGLPTDRVAVVPADSLGPPPAMDRDGNAPATAAPLRVAAATLALESAALAARLQTSAAGRSARS
jgi:hypothetical protein